jgi:hypothetical protein
MAGGLLNIIYVGNNNVFLTGNPCKTFFKVAYVKYTNFGLQKFRIDYSGQRDLRPSEDSTFTFKMPRYADLLMDTYVVVNLPDIWSPVHSPSALTTDRWAPYDFKWVQNIGTELIKEINITCGGRVLQKFSGKYLQCMAERDFDTGKKAMFDMMTGNVPELYDPMNSLGRNNSYPSAIYTSNPSGAEPSIRGRQIFIPINTWFTMNSSCAFPLIALQYNELHINIVMRPIQDLFQVRDVFDYGFGYPYVRPDFNETRFQMYRFLQTPPAALSDPSYYETKVNTWNADIHLISTYCFLSKEETKRFASEDQVFLIREVFEYNFENISNTKKLKLETNGMVANWMWFLQRNDVKLRNEWSNYTNWPYHNLPSNVTLAPIAVIPGTEEYLIKNYLEKFPDLNTIYGAGVHPKSLQNSGITITGDYHNENRKDILEAMGILINGEYRENIMTNGVYNYIEKYARSNGTAREGLYCYNFCLHTSPFEYQPSGAMNMSQFKSVELEVNTYSPTLDSLNSNYDVVCDDDGEIIGVRKTNWRLYEYTYNLTLFEERYNILSIINGSCGMLYSR